MRILAFLEYTAVVVGVIGVLAGQFFGLPKGLHLGIFLIGAGVALAGLESVFTRRMCFRFSEDRYEAYTGAPSLIVGLMALLAGTAVIASAYLLTEGLWHATVNYLVRRPGPVLVASGLLLAGAGALMMLNPRGRRGVWWTLMVRVPRATLGFIIIVAGVAGIGLGIWESLDATAFDRFTRNLPRTLEWRAFERWWWGLFGPRR